YIVHHIGYDERRDAEVLAVAGGRPPSPLDELAEVVAAVSAPVQAVGGLSVEQAVETVRYGATLVVLGAPLVIDADAFGAAGGDLEAVLREVVERVRTIGQEGLH
ncbi:MAG: D-arabino 3-hexulose 6-phosphate aldehyde lyase, partial [Chloroflexia bacterium]